MKHNTISVSIYYIKNRLDTLTKIPFIEQMTDKDEEERQRCASLGNILYGKLNETAD